MLDSIIIFCFLTGEHCTEHTVPLRRKHCFENADTSALSFPQGHPGSGCSSVWPNSLPRWWLQKGVASGASWRATKAQQCSRARWCRCMEPRHTSPAGTAATDKNSVSKTFYSAFLRFFLGDFLLTSYSFTPSFNDCELRMLEFPCVMPMRRRTLTICQN